MNKRERLISWIKTLDRETIDKVLLNCIEELIMSEVVCFYETTDVPYYDTTGERLDETT